MEGGLSGDRWGREKSTEEKIPEPTRQKKPEPEPT